MPGSKSANLALEEIAKGNNLSEFDNWMLQSVPEIKAAIHPETDHYMAFGAPSRLVARYMLRLRLLRNQGAPQQPWDHWPAHHPPPG